MDWSPPPCFKAYDIRGRVPDELNPPLAYDIGRAFASVHQAGKVAVGRDIRLSGHELSRALIAGLVDMGADVLDLGLCGTEEIYHAAFSLEGEGVDGGIIVTASHNPADYNGMKFVTRGARPVTGESGLRQMAERICRSTLPAPVSRKGLYAGQLSTWRKELAEHGQAGLAARKPGRKPADPRDKELERLKKANARLEQRAYVAEQLVDLQKKVLHLFDSDKDGSKS
jgi:phosphomannomutase